MQMHRLRLKLLRVFHLVGVLHKQSTVEGNNVVSTQAQGWTTQGEMVSSTVPCKLKIECLRE